MMNNRGNQIAKGINSPRSCSWVIVILVRQRENDRKSRQFVAVPKGVVHSWTKELNVLTRSLVFLVPGGFDEFLMEIGKPLEEAEQNSLPPTQEKIDYAISIAGDYHMEIIQ